MQNGEHTEEWPAADRPFSVDDSDAPVSLSSEADSDDEENLRDAAADAADEAANAAAEAEEMSDEEADRAEALMNGEVDESANDVNTEGDVDITNGGARDIDATNVSITQGGARDIDAKTVTVNQGGVGRIQAEEVSVSQGGIGLARADHLTIQEGGNAFAVMADKATLDPETSVFLLVAGSTTGDVRPVLDWRAALAIGAGFAVALSTLRRLGR
jgi:hypothetical protein